MLRSVSLGKVLSASSQSNLTSSPRESNVLDDPSGRRMSTSTPPSSPITPVLHPPSFKLPTLPPLPIDWQGILYKKGLLGSWKKCEFRLSGRTLLYHTTPNQDVPDKLDWRAINLEECVVKKADGLTNRLFSFAIFVGDKKTVLLAADSEESKRDWVQAIKASSGHDLGKMKMLHLLEGMHDCVVVSDEKGIIIGFNRAAKHMFGYTHSDVIGKNVDILMPSPYKDLHQAFINKHVQTGVSTNMGITRRVLGMRKDQTPFPLEIGLGRIHTQDGKIRFIATMREISTSSNVETLSVVETAHTSIQTNLANLQGSIETEFDKLKERIMELEHDKRDLEKMNESLKKKVEYHIRWREAANSVLRDQQRQEIKQALGGFEYPGDDMFDDVHKEFQLQTSLLVNTEMLKALQAWMPERYRIPPTLLYSTLVHGTSLQTFFARCNAEPNLVLIRTLETNHVFGAYCSSGWVKSDRYYGDGQCFLFTLLPRMKKYGWNPGQPNYFMMANDKFLVVGGGGKGYGLWIDSSLETGMSSQCDAFDNDPLANQEHFRIAVLEVFTFY